MEWVESLNQSMNYIEEHLTGEIDYEQLGRIACCSAYHYQRMFTYMAGITLAEYIRRRKMSLAAVDLQGGNERIIDIAEKYGYRSPTAFNRAFQSFHGTTPSSVKNEGVSVKSFSPIVFRIAVKGATEMNYRIETKEAFRIIGVSAPLAIFSGTGTNQSIQELEQRIITEWLPTSGYEYANAPDIEVYLNPDPQNAQYEVWIPVSKKKE